MIIILAMSIIRVKIITVIQNAMITSTLAPAAMNDVVAHATADASFGSERGQSIGAGEALEDGASGVV
jgi:hypothetical protein